MTAGSRGVAARHSACDLVRRYERARRQVAVAACGLALGGVSACFIEVPTAKHSDPCDRVACASDGYCDAGKCYCEPGYVGDAYSPNGCQLPPPQQNCEAPCGLNATCEGTTCVCVAGTVAVCGTGDCLPEDRLCDGALDCSNGADEDEDSCSTEVTAAWFFVDACDDELDVQWRLWAVDRDWVWPGRDQTFVSAGYGQSAREVIACRQGETICFGAAAGQISWGLGIDGDSPCASCCVACEEGSVDFGALGCNGE